MKTANCSFKIIPFHLVLYFLNKLPTTQSHVMMMIVLMWLYHVFRQAHTLEGCVIMEQTR